MIRAFVEAPAGLAAVSLRLHGGQHCRPPISRMGNKAGYSAVILAALGLRSGEGASAYVWAESDPDVRALLRAYPDPDMLRRIADIIRGWKDEEPRALWERLRAERKARGPVLEDASLAGWIVGGAWAMRRGQPESGYTESRTATGIGEGHGDDTETIGDRCHRLAEYASIVASNRVAGMVVDAAWTYNAAAGGGGCGFANPTKSDGSARGSTAEAIGGACGRIASRWPPVAVLATLPTAAELSALLGTPGDLEGVVIYGDADYKDTTGYADTCREMMPDLARGWDAAGAVVCLSEAEPYPELPTWHACEITGGRRGQKRTFSKQQREWLTMNREPAHRVATQVSMFGGAA